MGVVIRTSVIEVATTEVQQLVDITAQAKTAARSARVEEGVCSLYAHGATAALMIQENDDPNIAFDVLDCLNAVAPAGRWRHDKVDDNGAAHIKAGIVGPSESVPIRDGELALSTWQNVFLCDFDGPRVSRRILVTIVGVGA